MWVVKVNTQLQFFSMHKLIPGSAKRGYGLHWQNTQYTGKIPNAMQRYSMQSQNKQCNAKIRNALAGYTIHWQDTQCNAKIHNAKQEYTLQRKDSQYKAKIQIALPGYTLSPYTDERRDVSENTPPEAREISRGQGFCTPRPEDNLEGNFDKYWKNNLFANVLVM